ncbi:MAG TPA: OmpH family outer membrane protein [Longimicrobium sp.]|nr:OmpH family outer membrane protein [Longimicrobium sp.]
MKRFLSVSVAGAVAALAVAVVPAAAQQRVGFVNSQRILAEAPGLQQVQQTLQRELPGLRAPLDSLEQRLTAGQQQLQQQSATLSEQVRTQRQNELQQQYQAYQQRAQALQQQAQRREAELVQPVMTAINAAIEAERRAANYDYIMDSSGNGIVAVNPALDLTERVLARLRGGAPAAAPAPRP